MIAFVKWRDKKVSSTLKISAKLGNKIKIKKQSGKTICVVL